MKRTARIVFGGAFLVALLAAEIAVHIGPAETPHEDTIEADDGEVLSEDVDDDRRGALEQIKV